MGAWTEWYYCRLNTGWEMATEWMTHKHWTITASSILHHFFGLNLLSNHLLPWTPAFHCSLLLTLTFEIPVALNRPLGVSPFTFNFLSFIHVRLSPQPSTQLSLCPLWLPDANISLSVSVFMHTYAYAFTYLDILYMVHHSCAMEPQQEKGVLWFWLCVRFAI